MDSKRERREKLQELTRDQEERASKLHREALVIDSLGLAGPWVITPEIHRRVEEMAAASSRPSAIAIVHEMELLTQRALLRGELPEFWEGWTQSGVDASSVTVGAFGDRPFTYESAVKDLARWTQAFDSLDGYQKVTSGADVRRAKSDGRRGIILNFQNALPVGDDLSNLDFFYQLGVRVIQLTYNQRNLVGDGCTERYPSGLSYFGLQMLKEMNELGILVDLSHCSEPTTLDAIEASEKPVSVTHSFCKALSDHDRGKSDEVIRVLGEKGGYFGILIVPFFITSEPIGTLDHFIRHLDRVVDLIGPKHVGIGTDWGIEFPKPLIRMMNEEMHRFGFREEHRVDWGARVDGFRQWREWPNITRALVARGYADDEIRGFLGENFLRVFEDSVG